MPHLWPPLFPITGVYDIPHDKIYIKGELPKTSYRQTLKHEKAHRKWFLNHRLIRKITVLLYGKTALYYIISIFTTIIFLCSALLWVRSLMIYFGVLSIILFLLHLIMFRVIFEIPAWTAAGFFMKGMKIKEILQSVGMDSFMMVTPFLLMAIGFWSFGPSAAFIFLGFGLLISWIFLIYIFVWTLAILRKRK